MTSFHPVQAQPFTLSGAGAIMGATSVVLTSFTQIDGTLLTMADFGSKGFMTMEPGNSTLEEQISFTGVTQNGNGTATLSGIKTVLMVSPYTETSGFAQTHAGATTVVLSNTAGFYDQFLAKADDATISAVYTFTAPSYPEIDDESILPTLQAQFATKEYVDGVVLSGAPDATTSVKGIVQLPTQAQVDARTATGGTGAALSVTPDVQRSTKLSDYAADSGTANAYIIAPTPSVTALVAGTRVTFKVANTNTTTSTVVVNALSGTAIFKNDGATALVAGDLVAGQVVELEHNGVNGFMLMTPPIKGLVPSQSGASGEFLKSDGTSATWGRCFDYQAFTGSGTWTKPTGLSGNEVVLVQLWGGGGAGGGAPTGLSRSGGGGGGGGFSEAKFRASNLSSTVTVTIGAGGTGVSATDGNPGGDTTFGAIMTAYGGAGGIMAADGTGGAGGNSHLGFGTSIYNGGAGGTANAVGTRSTFGGAGGGGGGSGTGGAGGAGYFGGSGGGAGSKSGGSGGAGGAASTLSGYGGAGGNGNAAGNNDGSASVALAGGGGGAGNNAAASNFIGGDGFRGECRVWVFL